MRLLRTAHPLSLFRFFVKPPVAAPARPRVVEREYRLRIVFRQVSQTRIEPWVVAPTVDEALALARRRYPTAAEIAFLNEVRDIPEAGT